mgnify:CR=1 FL=1
MSFPILSLLILTPIIGALTLSLSSSTQLKNKTIFLSGLWITTGEFLLSLLLPIFYDKSKNGYQFIEFHTWFDKFDINYYVGVDGVSIPLILLTTFLVPICLLCSINSIQNRAKEFVIYFLLLESFIIGVFVSIDLVIFYVFFEAVGRSEIYQFVGARYLKLITLQRLRRLRPGRGRHGVPLLAGLRLRRLPRLLDQARAGSQPAAAATTEKSEEKGEGRAMLPIHPRPVVRWSRFPCQSLRPLRRAACVPQARPAPTRASRCTAYKGKPSSHVAHFPPFSLVFRTVSASTAARAPAEGAEGAGGEGARQADLVHFAGVANLHLLLRHLRARAAV